VVETVVGIYLAVGVFACMPYVAMKRSNDMPQPLFPTLARGNGFDVLDKEGLGGLAWWAFQVAVWPLGLIEWWQAARGRFS
jgi:hypothetical protein